MQFRAGHSPGWGALGAWLGLAALLSLLAGCAVPAPYLQVMNPVQSYQQALQTLPGTSFPPGSVAEKQALERFARFFGHLNETNAQALTRETYAERFYFYDTLKAVRELSELEKYFLETARNTESVQARIEDVARSGADYYVRWTMEIRLKKFQRGRTLTSVGVTHLRFNEEGKILLHHDYWDAASGFYQHVPVLGSVIRYIRSLF